MFKRSKPIKITIALIISALSLILVSSLVAQLKKEEVNFEVLATVTMKKGDVLWNLAKEYYKDPLKWKYIAEMNKIKDERRIPVGTVIYIPVEDAKRIVSEAERVAEAKKAVVDETALKLAELQKELERARAEQAECARRAEELAAALKDREALIADLEGRIKSLNQQLEAQAELEAQLDELRVAAKAASEKRDEISDLLRAKEASIAEKESRISELEARLRATKADMERIEKEKEELKAKIKKAEEAMKPEKPKYVSDPRARVAAIAIGLVGSIIWMASSK